jgi:hypothetical protein
MPTSSNSLFHFFDSFEILENILTDKLYPSFCRERISFSNRHYEISVPMVSFCDIPLFQVKDHITKYGKFGIGFNMNWAKKNNLNPVFYIDKNSWITKNIDQLGYSIMDLTKNKINAAHEDKSELWELTYYWNIFFNLKNYSGDLKRKSGELKDYKFYDEREWRFIPQLNKEDEQKITISKEKYEQYRGNYNNPKPLLRDYKLDFSATDIEYIIIENKSEVTRLINFLKNTKSLGDTKSDIEFLYTKIFTIEQILEDF